MAVLLSKKPSNSARRQCQWLFGINLSELSIGCWYCVFVWTIVWGFIGPPNARFKNFFPSFSGIKNHFYELKQRKMKQEQGHNPLGGLMVFAILVLFLVQAVTGFLREEIDALYGDSFLTSLHGISANIIFALVIIHIIAVFITAYLGKIELIRPMINGKRRQQPHDW